MQNWLDLTQLFRLLRGCVRTAKCNPTQGDDARPSPRHSHQFFRVFCDVVDAKITNPRQGQTARKVSRASCARPTARIVVMLLAVR